MKITMKKYSQNFLNLSSAWYTPCTILKVESFFNFFSLDQRICFPVTDLRCHYGHLHFILCKQITLARIQDLQHHFQCLWTHSPVLHRYVCSYTLSMLQCRDKYRIPGLSQHISYRTRIQNYQKSAKDVNFGYDVRFSSSARYIFSLYFKIHWIRLF